MAVKLKKSFAINVGAIVQNATQAAKKARAQVQSSQEAEFQKAVADGLSYEAQVAFRQQQINEERSSTVPDPDFVTQLEKSVGDLQRLNRFSKYRAKYQKSFADERAGRETAQEHLDILNNLLLNTTDPQLREEIQGNIVSAETDVKQYKDNILQNQIKKAQYDGTSSVLGSTIATIKDKRALAAMKGNEEEVTALDATLSVLNQQLNKVTIEDATDKLQVTSLAKGLSPIGKVKAVNDLISSANNTDPVTIDGKTYGSVAEYWTQTRDSYLSGSGKGIFNDFFKELDNVYSDKVNAAIARDGFATTLTLDAIKNETNDLKSKPEMVPFLEKVNNLQAITLANAFQSTAKTIIDRASNNADFKTADTALTDYGTKYGIDAQNYRLQLGDILSRQILSAASATGEAPGNIRKQEGLDKTLTPDQFKVPTPTTDQTKTPSPTRTFSNKETADLTAAQARIASGQGSAIDKQNVAYALKQGWSVVPGASTVLPTTTPVPATTPVPVPVPTTTPTSTPPPTSTPAPTTTPAPTPTPAPTTPAPNPVTPQPVAPSNPVAPVAPTATPKPYTGVSVVDYLKSVNQDASHGSLVKLAQQNGIQGYAGTAEQNTTLLKKLRGV